MGVLAAAARPFAAFFAGPADLGEAGADSGAGDATGAGTGAGFSAATFLAAFFDAFLATAFLAVPGTVGALWGSSENKEPAVLLRAADLAAFLAARFFAAPEPRAESGVSGKSVSARGAGCIMRSSGIVRIVEEIN